MRKGDNSRMWAGAKPNVEHATGSELVRALARAERRVVELSAELERFRDCEAVLRIVAVEFGYDGDMATDQWKWLMVRAREALRVAEVDE